MGLNNRERLDEGCLVVYAHKGGNRFRLALNGLLVTAGFSRHLDWVTLRGSTITVTGQSASLDVTRDGEIITLSLPLEYRVHAGKLKVVAP
jgi:hypothetical protein